MPAFGLFWRDGDVVTVADLRRFLEGWEEAQPVRLAWPTEAGFYGVIVEPAPVTER
jgi:hypothetical protein